MGPKLKKAIDNSTCSHSYEMFATYSTFTCDGCKTVGTGQRFQCDACYFDLHEYCGDCPKTLLLFMHPHSLTLAKPKPVARTRHEPRTCHVCRDSIEGMLYTCKACDFHVHPLCTQLPEKLNHALDKIHPLILRSSDAAGLCAVCRGPCDGWRYGCGVCGFDMHFECVSEPVVRYPQNGEIGRFKPFRAPAFYEFDYSPVIANSIGPSRGVEKSMAALVAKLGYGVHLDMIFGVDVSKPRSVTIPYP